jgi:hypothetical protein
VPHALLPVLRDRWGLDVKQAMLSPGAADQEASGVPAALPALYHDEQRRQRVKPSQTGVAPGAFRRFVRALTACSEGDRNARIGIAQMGDCDA